MWNLMLDLLSLECLFDIELELFRQQVTYIPATQKGGSLEDYQLWSHWQM